MANHDLLSKQLRDVTNRYITLTKQFRQSSYDLGWLVTNNFQYWPAYQTINTAGDSFYSKMSNFYFGKQNFLKKKIINTICYKLNDGYVKPLGIRNITFENSDLIFFWNMLSAELDRYWPIIHHWTYTELFSYLTAFSNTFFKSIGLDLNLYQNDKSKQNEFGLKSYNELRQPFIDDKLPLKYLLYLVVKANWIDNYQLDPNTFMLSFSEEINDILDQTEWVNELIDSNPLFYNSALENDIYSSHKHFLYECDNSGEIFFDLILVEYLLLHGHKVIMVLKSNPILNDITYVDFKSLLASDGLNHLDIYTKTGQLSYIQNSTSDVIPLRYLATDTYINAYQQASIAIFKGQGHFESLPKIITSKRKKHPVNYLKKHYHLFGIKSEHTLTSIRMLHEKAELNQFILLR